MEERWIVIPAFNGRYFISDIGRVKNSNGRILTPQVAGNGYLQIHLVGSSRRYFIHRLVAEAFIPNPLNKEQVNHKKGVKNDNRLSELEWVTPKENYNHSIEMGLSVKRNNCKLTKEQVLEIRKRNRSQIGDTAKIAREYGVLGSTISDIFNYKTWQNI